MTKSFTEAAGYIKRALIQYDDGLITAFEALKAIEHTLGQVDRGHLKDAHNAMPLTPEEVATSSLTKATERPL
jgi:hypothetical protein